MLVGPLGLEPGTSRDITEADYNRKGGKVPDKPSLIHYFDLDRNALRSFNIYQLVA
ncbi:MAG: hypothetical protein AAF502_17995 [Bacteroidota bacterium]